MGRSLYLIVVLGLFPGALAACVPISIDPTRDRFGVSTARTEVSDAGPTGPQLAELDRKARQICTTGYEGEAPTIQPATAGYTSGTPPVRETAQQAQLVNQQLRCSHYDRLRFDYWNMSWSNIF